MGKKKSSHHKNSTAQHQHQHQQQNQNNQNPQNQEIDSNPHPTATAAAIEDPTEKLKSQNEALLKEANEKRQEMSALLEANKSLESELTRSVSEVDGLRAKLAKMEEVEKENEVLKEAIRENDASKQESKKLEVEEGDKLREKLGDLKSRYQAVKEALEERDKKVESMRIELGSMRRKCEERNREIESLNGAKADLEKRVSDKDVRIGELENEAIKFLESKKMNDEMKMKVEGLSSELNVLMEERRENEKEMERLKNRLGEMEKMKSKQENEIFELRDADLEYQNYFQTLKVFLT